jgi:hypothetical protein
MSVGWIFFVGGPHVLVCGPILLPRIEGHPFFPHDDDAYVVHSGQKRLPEVLVTPMDDFVPQYIDELSEGV